MHYRASNSAARIFTSEGQQNRHRRRHRRYCHRRYRRYRRCRSTLPASHPSTSLPFPSTLLPLYHRGCRHGLLHRQQSIRSIFASSSHVLKHAAAASALAPCIMVKHLRNEAL